MSEPEGFRDFVAARATALLRTAWLLTEDWAAAQDLVQTALAKTWPHWERVARRGDPEPYVRRVMVTTYASWWRRRWRGEVPTAKLPDRTVPLDAYAGCDDRDALARALARLPRRQRAVVVLRFYDDLSEARTAEALGCSVGTVKSQTAKALATLRRTPGLSIFDTGLPASEEKEVSP